MVADERFPIVESVQIVESLRDSGYKSAASAGAELCDNSFEAGASTFLVTIEENDQPDIPRGRGRPPAPGIKRVIFSDDGSGMDPVWLRNSVRFGFSSRYNSRESMGRFGMGLPNASISQARMFTVYSRIPGSEWYMVRINLIDVFEGRISEVPSPVAADPDPAYVVPNSESGTIVVWEDLDRLNANHKSADKLKSHFITDLSRIFRYFLEAGRVIAIKTPKSDWDEIRPFDPLYLMPESTDPGAREHGDPIRIHITTSRGVTDEVVVRFSLTPLDWRMRDGIAIRAGKDHRINSNRGVSFVRAGREIDFTSAGGLKGPHPMNMWWSAEVSFPATLDEAFGIEFTKQRVVLTEELRQKLLDKAFHPNVATLNKILDEQRPAAPTPVTSAPAEEIAARLRGRLRPVQPPTDKPAPPPEREQQLLEDAVEAGRRREGETEEEAEQRVRRELPFVLQGEDRPDAPFYRIETFGPRTHIILNTYHPFYRKVYLPLEQIGGNALTGVQLLLFALAQGEAQGGPDTKHYYEDERQQWSALLTLFLRELSDQPVTIGVTALNGNEAEE